MDTPDPTEVAAAARRLLNQGDTPEQIMRSYIAGRFIHILPEDGRALVALAKEIGDWVMSQVPEFVRCPDCGCECRVELGRLE